MLTFKEFVKAHQPPEIKPEFGLILDFIVEKGGTAKLIYHVEKVDEYEVLLPGVDSIIITTREPFDWTVTIDNVAMELSYIPNMPWQDPSWNGLLEKLGLHAVKVRLPEPVIPYATAVFLAPTFEEIDLSDLLSTGETDPVEEDNIEQPEFIQGEFGFKSEVIADLVQTLSEVVAFNPANK